MALNADALSKLRNAIQEEVDEKEKEDSERNSNNIPIIYIGTNGKMRVKILYNMKSNTVQRKIIRHHEGDKKIPCLSMYNQDCPICNAIHDTEDLYGKECGVWGDHHSKIRGMCYAILVDFDAAIFNDKSNPPKKGDTVILMYPPSVYDGINKILLDSGDHLESLLAKNDGNTVEIKREKVGKEFPKYTISVYPYGTEKIKADDQEFDTLLDSIPDLNDTLVPKDLTETDLTNSKAAAETIKAQYANGTVINPKKNEPAASKSTENNIAPAANKEPAQSTQNANIAAPAAAQTGSSGITDELGADGRPLCFGCGKHSDTDPKCLICNLEADCIVSSAS
jgi:hypothetical protein